MYDKIYSDPVLYEFHKDADKEKLKQMQVEFLSKVTGGPSGYGKNLKDIHKGLGIGT